MEIIESLSAHPMLWLTKEEWFNFPGREVFSMRIPALRLYNRLDYSHLVNDANFDWCALAKGRCFKEISLHVAKGDQLVNFLIEKRKIKKVKSVIGKKGGTYWVLFPNKIQSHQLVTWVKIV